MKTLRVVFLSFFLLFQLVMPTRAYAFAPVVGLVGVASAGGGAAWSAGSTAAFLTMLATGITLGGIAAYRLDGNTSQPVPGWTPKPGPDGLPYSAPPESAAKGRQCFVYDSGGKTCEAVCAAMGYTSHPNSPDQCMYEKTIVAYGLPHYYVAQCPSGYSLGSDGTCGLVAPFDVQKPAGVECEIVFRGGQFKFDPSNPACAGKSKTTKNGCDVSISGNSLSIVCQQGAEAMTMGDGAVSVTTPAGTKTGTAVAADGGVQVSVPPGVLGAPQLDPVGSGTGTETGTGTGTGTGTETENQPSQPPVEGDWKVPDLYESKGRSFLDEWKDFKKNIDKAQLVKSVGSFFDVAMVGECPDWGIPAFSVGFVSIGPWPVTAQCEPLFTRVLQLTSAVLIFGASIVAFRVAMTR